MFINVQFMEKRILAHAQKIRSNLFDDHYTLYQDGSVLHEYGKNIQGFDFTEHLSIRDLSPEVKVRLYDAAKEEDKEEVKKVLIMWVI
ncbi:MAG: hypothetical protein BGO31_11760 [Bacteroidetes bacterium 43-16]|nr:MAG: hypothetical protein BGO31_11760 [Bacteroidetes bacterium 43-16]